MAKRLLIVDDEPALLMAVAACLRSEGYDVKTARSARDALVYLSTAVPDLIVSDVRMPHMDGFEFAKLLRSSTRTELIPIVFLSAKDALDDRIEGFRSGVDAYLVKPFEPTELIAVVANILLRVDRTHSVIANMIGTDHAEIEDTAFDEGLTNAEGRIANEVAKGLSNKEIAAELNLSVRTIENHISRILDKKGFSNRVELARYILENRQKQ
jgi:DNA-binding NarL/FixJ family response regulator